MPEIPLPAIIKGKRNKFIASLILFAVCAAGIVGLLQGGLYLSSARNASGEILGAATNAYADLNNASSNLSHQNLADAAELFQSASNNIKLAQGKLDDYKPLTWLTPQASSADHLLSGAGFLASAGEKLTAALNLFGEFKVSSAGVETSDFTQKLAANKDMLEQSRDLIQKSAQQFSAVNSIPMDYEGSFEKAKQQVNELGLVLDKLVGLENLYLNIFGGQKTYLLIFQNYDEQRATGGFIGTYGFIRTSNGKITKLQIDSIYDLDGQIYELVAAPGPFQPEIPRWGIRDANWFADFPTSAEKLLYFFEKGGETADGLISTTPKIFEDLLGLVGPIEMPDYDVILTADNFQDTVQYKTSIAYDRKLNQPKKMLADFAPILLDRLNNLPQDQWFKLFQIMQDNLNERQILLYSKNVDAQQTIESLGFSGKVLPTDFDYLSIINTNLGGTKTDLEMEQTISLKSKVLSDGSIINTLVINRQNPASEHNRDYMRVLVPQGSILVSEKGFDNYPVYPSSAKGLRIDPDLAKWDEGVSRSDIFIRTEAGKTEFAGWLDVEGESEKTATLTYVLPFKLGQTHSLLVQKQAGSKAFSLSGEIELGSRGTAWVSKGVTTGINSVKFQSDTNTDDFWGVVIK